MIISSPSKLLRGVIISLVLGMNAHSARVSAQSPLLIGPQQGLIQSHYGFNPAFTPPERLTISIPPLLPPFPGPGIGFSISSSAFALSDVIKPGSNGQTLLDTKSILANASSMNSFAVSFQTELLNAGLHLGERHFLSLQISNRAELNWDYSEDMLRLVLKGNGADGILGKETRPDFYLDGIHYSNIGVGYSTSLMEGRLKAGIRIHYLSGQEHIKTEKSEISLLTDENDFSLKGSADILIRTSGLNQGVFQGELNPIRIGYLFGTGNAGAGMDAGISYSLNDKWQIAAAVNEVGFIRWQKDVKTYISREPGANVEFQGVDLTDYQDENLTVQEAFEEITDSLSARFDLDQNDKGYTSFLNIRTVASATYVISNRQSATLLIQNTSYGKRLHPDISLSYSLSMGKWFQTSLSWSYIDRTAGNVGLFLSAHPGVFHWYICTDNVLGMLLFDRYNGIPVPAYTRHTSLRAGFNLTLGKPTAED